MTKRRVDGTEALHRTSVGGAQQARTTKRGGPSSQLVVASTEAGSVERRKSRPILTLKVRFYFPLAKPDPLVLVICKKLDLIAAMF